MPYQTFIVNATATFLATSLYAGHIESDDSKKYSAQPSRHMVLTTFRHERSHLLQPRRRKLQRRQIRPLRTR